ncbi:type II secretion system minor pseudopilin GspH [Thioalkalivibrio sp. XN279]|uniref:type II secretion system minor pseudopilin GspH n=1 Tax=Thioalkalivibrio sp. XN279 TaxID=2714953 RepID=UPI00140C6036|nr:type II secretion system minor pseudopilin GspH [Thioalkalivibrio sp. XN279]NHA14461.1 type II secretion system minor pseudopilin GspH [Thioalkalivibrio sp. XN279]
MQKSATGLSTEPLSRPGRASGFSLIELLVVIVILAITAAMVVLGTATLKAGDPAETESRRLAALLQFVAEEALVQGRDYGVEFFPDGYRFLSWDPDSRLWSVVEDEAALRRRTLPPGLELVLAVDGREVVVEPEGRRRQADAESLAPQVAIFSSGELTPFELFLVQDFAADAWLLRGQVDGEVALLSPEETR